MLTARSLSPGVVVLMLVAVLPWVRGETMGVEVEARDRLELQAQLAEYAHAWDSKDATAFARLFTEDAGMAHYSRGSPEPNFVVEGREAIEAYARTAFADRLADRQTRHHFSNVVVRFPEPSRAVTENIALITHQVGAAPPFVTATGVYRIVWLRTEAGWRIARRNLTVDR